MRVNYSRGPIRRPAINRCLFGAAAGKQACKAKDESLDLSRSQGCLTYPATLRRNQQLELLMKVAQVVFLYLAPVLYSMCRYQPKIPAALESSGLGTKGSK